eukprot:TRINITY_DN2974_c0_g1_i1.p1 TRINITY_DN2974_c0_g1~~TRINITY_DN2974_c0_g1_i1.p1  ORF type:complete len:226 (+),score=49.53 TRINITY_DN2974_c0_g1_i1:86-763(+)
MTVSPAMRTDPGYDIISGDPRAHKRPDSSLSAGSGAAAARRLADGGRKRPVSAMAGGKYSKQERREQQGWGGCGEMCETPSSAVAATPKTTGAMPGRGKQTHARTTTLAQAISSIRATMDEQLLFSQKNSAIAQWHTRPRTATLLRSSHPASDQYCIHPSEQRHQASLATFFTQCQTYRTELKKWERETSRSSAAVASFPQFGVRRRPFKRHEPRAAPAPPTGLL